MSEQAMNQTSQADNTDQQAPPTQDAAAQPQSQPQQADPTANYPASPDQGGPNPVVQNAPQSAPAAAAASAPSGSKWGNIVKGALAGFLTGGLPGVAEGLILPKTAQQNLQIKRQATATQQQQAQANVRFTNAQAANLQQETAVRQIQAEQAPKALQLKIQEQDTKNAEDLMNRGLTPAFVTDADHPEAYRAALQSYSDSNGGVPAIVSYHMGDKIVAFNLDQMGQNPGMLSEINRRLSVQGGQQLTNGQFMNPKYTPPAVKSKLLSDTAHFFNPVPETDPDKLKTQTYQYANYLAAAKALPDDTPDKAKTVDQLTKAVANLKGAPAANGPTEKTKAAIQIANARGAAFNNSKIIPVIDEQGNLTLSRAGSAADRGLAPGGEGAKLGAKQSQLGDIKTGLDAVRSDVGKLDTPFSVAQVAQLNLAIHSKDETTLQASVSALNNQNLTREQKQFVVDIVQLHERAMSMRNIAGLGGQSSDMMRSAIYRMLPGASSGDREMMTKQLDAMEQQLSILGKGLPKVKGLPTTGGAAAGSPASDSQTFTHLSASGKFGWNGTKWVPTGK